MLRRFARRDLAHAGARVIKIEREGGDFARGYDEAAKGDSSYFAWINQGKESVVLDFKEQDDKTLLKSIISKADILVQNLAPGALQRVGLGLDELRKQHPRLITCDISGYGDSAELAEMKAYDLLVQAESGLIGISGGPNELGRIGVSICDIGAGMTAHAGILEALIKRNSTGKGEGIEVSLFDVAADWMTVPLLHAEHGLGAPERVGLQHPSIAPYGAYETSDNEQTLISIQNEREWKVFCIDVLDRPEMAKKPDYASNNLRVKNRQALNAEIHEATSQFTARSFRKKLAKSGIAFGAVNSVQDLSEHKALSRMEIRNSTGERFSIPTPPIKTHEGQSNSAGPVPKIGEHTQKIRSEFSDS